MDLYTIIISGVLVLGFIYSLLISFVFFSDEYSFAGIVLRMIPFMTIAGLIIVINNNITLKELISVMSIALVYAIVAPSIKRKK